MSWRTAPGANGIVVGVDPDESNAPLAGAAVVAAAAATVVAGAAELDDFADPPQATVTAAINETPSTPTRRRTEQESENRRDR